MSSISIETKERVMETMRHKANPPPAPTLPFVVTKGSPRGRTGGKKMKFSDEQVLSAATIFEEGGAVVKAARSLRCSGPTAKKCLIEIALNQGTIPYEVLGRFGAAKVLLKPASQGTGVIAGGAVRAVVESVGILNILTKCLGSRNPHNVIRATIEGLRLLKNPDAIALKRGKTVQEIV